MRNLQWKKYVGSDGVLAFDADMRRGPQNRAMVTPLMLDGEYVWEVDVWTRRTTWETMCVYPPGTSLRTAMRGTMALLHLGMDTGMGYES